MSPLALRLSAQGDAERHGRDIGQRGSEQIVMCPVTLVVGIRGRQLQGDQFFRVRTAGRVRRAIPLISLKAQVTMQMPRASESSATAVKPGEPASERSA